MQTAEDTDKLKGEGAQFAYSLSYKIEAISKKASLKDCILSCSSLKKVLPDGIANTEYRIVHIGNQKQQAFNKSLDDSFKKKSKAADLSAENIESDFQYGHLLVDYKAKGMEACFSGNSAIQKLRFPQKIEPGKLNVDKRVDIPAIDKFLLIVASMSVDMEWHDRRGLCGALSCLF